MEISDQVFLLTTLLTPGFPLIQPLKLYSSYSFSGPSLSRSKPNSLTHRPIDKPFDFFDLNLFVSTNFYHPRSFPPSCQRLLPFSFPRLTPPSLLLSQVYIRFYIPCGRRNIVIPPTSVALFCCTLLGY